MFAGTALSVRLVVYAGLSLFIISGPYLYMVVCILYAYNLTILPPRCGPGHPPRPDPPTSPLGVGLDPLARPLNLPPGVDLDTPLARPLNFPPGCGPRNPPGQIPQLPLWVWA